MRRFPDPPDNSLFCDLNSLFCDLNSLFQCLGNSAKKSRKIRALRRVRGPNSSVIRENSLFFPCLTGNSGETGSLETLCTPNLSKGLAGMCNGRIFGWQPYGNQAARFRGLGSPPSVDPRISGGPPLFHTPWSLFLSSGAAPASLHHRGLRSSDLPSNLLPGLGLGMVQSFSTAKVRLALYSCECQRSRRLFHQCQEGSLWQTRLELIIDIFRRHRSLHHGNLTILPRFAPWESW